MTAHLTDTGAESLSELFTKTATDMTKTYRLWAVPVLDAWWRERRSSQAHRPLSDRLPLGADLVAAEPTGGHVPAIKFYNAAGVVVAYELLPGVVSTGDVVSRDRVAVTVS